MNKTITIPVDLLEQVREIAGAEGVTDAQAVALCLEVGLEHTRKETALEGLRSILKAQDAGFSDMVLEYARTLSSMSAAAQGYLHDTAMSAAQIPQENVHPAWLFVRTLAGKKVGA